MLDALPRPVTKLAFVIFLKAPLAEVSLNKIKSSSAIDVSAVCPVIVELVIAAISTQAEPL